MTAWPAMAPRAATRARTPAHLARVSVPATPSAIWVPGPASIPAPDVPSPERALPVVSSSRVTLVSCVTQRAPPLLIAPPPGRAAAPVRAFAPGRTRVTHRAAASPTTRRQAPAVAIARRAHVIGPTLATARARVSKACCRMRVPVTMACSAAPATAARAESAPPTGATARAGSSATKPSTLAAVWVAPLTEPASRREE